MTHTLNHCHTAFPCLYHHSLQQLAHHLWLFIRGLTPTEGPRSYFFFNLQIQSISKTGYPFLKYASFFFSVYSSPPQLPLRSWAAILSLLGSWQWSSAGLCESIPIALQSIWHVSIRPNCFLSQLAQATLLLKDTPIASYFITNKLKLFVLA